MFLKLQSTWKICPVHWISDSHNYQVYTEIEATFAILRKNELAFMLYKNVHMFLGIFKATIFWISVWYTVLRCIISDAHYPYEVNAVIPIF